MRNDYTDFSGHMTVCAQCGYRFVDGDEALRVRQTGDIIHRDCWMDYTEDNREELSDIIDF